MEFGIYACEVSLEEGVALCLLGGAGPGAVDAHAPIETALLVIEAVSVGDCNEGI